MKRKILILVLAFIMCLPFTISVTADSESNNADYNVTYNSSEQINNSAGYTTTSGCDHGKWMRIRTELFSRTWISSHMTWVGPMYMVCNIYLETYRHWGVCTQCGTYSWGGFSHERIWHAICG
jgi:hypothetical protein